MICFVLLIAKYLFYLPIQNGGKCSFKNQICFLCMTIFNSRICANVIKSTFNTEKYKEIISRLQDAMYALPHIFHFVKKLSCISHLKCLNMNFLFQLPESMLLIGKSVMFCFYKLSIKYSTVVII